MADPSLQHCFFVQKNLYQGADAHLSRACNLLWQKSWPLGIHPKLFAVTVRGLVVVVVVMAIWSFRQRLCELVGRRGAWLFDEPVDAGWFQSGGRFAIALLVRSPALVLLWAAARSAMLVASQPIKPELAAILVPFQVVLAVLILTQTALPLCGAVLMGSWLYVATNGWTIAADAAPLLAVAAIYAFAPWRSHELGPPEVTRPASRIFRVAVGVSLVAGGFRDLFAYEQTVGLVERAPTLLDDPLVGLLMMGHSEGFARETWVAAVGAAQMMGGILIGSGVFTRLVALVAIAVLARLMLLDPSWARVLPLCAMLALITRDRPGSELGADEPDRSVKQRAITWGSLAALAATAVLPALYLISTLDRRGFR